MWWDETIARWKTEGLPTGLNDVFEISQYFGLDPYIQFWLSTTEATIEAKQHHVEGIVSNMDDYRQFLPLLKDRNIIPIVDTDGDVTRMVPWLLEEGFAGVLPLERQAKVDGNRLRKAFLPLCMVGHFDKLVMNQGEAAMRAEFERLAPLMRSGGFIPSVDHQTPPGVSLQQCKDYLRLLREYVQASGTAA